MQESPKEISDFQLLATAASYIRADLEREMMAEWQESPFRWALSLPPGSKGKLAKHLIFQWCALRGLDVSASPDPQADILVQGHRIEIKFSTLWRSGIYKFQQIRDQNYEYAVFLGISPANAHCWVVSKELLLQHVIGVLGQHTGKAGQDTAWVTVNPNNLPEWLRGTGGTLDQALPILKGLRKR